MRLWQLGIYKYKLNHESSNILGIFTRKSDVNNKARISGTVGSVVLQLRRSAENATIYQRPQGSTNYKQIIAF